MKKILPLITLLLTISLNAEIFTFVNDDKNEDSSILERVLALPAMKIDVSIKSCELEYYDNGGRILAKSNDVQGLDLQVNSFTMRELFAHKFTISPVKKKGVKSFLKSVTLETKAAEKAVLPKSISSVFSPLYQKVVDNFNESYLATLPMSAPKMLIIADESLHNGLGNFINWKREKGIEVEIKNSLELGSTNTSFKEYIQNYYNTNEHKPDYLLLIGDVDDRFAIPAFYHGPENDVTDHPYSLLSGDDYFPELLVGRLSADQFSEVGTIINKILAYEKTPYLANSSWFKRALLVAGNYAGPGAPVPITPVKVSKWLKEKLLINGFSEVKEIYEGDENGQNSGNADDIASFWTEGASFVSYRGWGDSHGWDKPEFKNNNLEELNNGYYLPILTTIVCGTGNFANQNVDPCFAENALRLGESNMPKGAVGAIGPSWLHTSTKYNNSLFSGFYSGIFDENLHNFGLAFLRGKWELYNNFPLNQDTGDNAEIYFMTYNMLGDPSLEMWTDVPQSVTYQAPDEVQAGLNYLDINDNRILSGVVCAVQNDKIIGRTDIKNGRGTIYLEDLSEGNFKLTITGKNILPYQKEISVVKPEAGLALKNINGVLIPGNQTTLRLTMQNCGTTDLTNLNFELKSANSLITIPENIGNIESIASGAEANLDFSLSLDEEFNSLNETNFSLTVIGLENQEFKFSVLPEGLNLEFADYALTDGSSIINPGEEKEIQVKIKNYANEAFSGVTGNLRAGSDALIVTQNSANFGSIGSNNEATANFTTTAASDCFSGRNIPLILTLRDDLGAICEQKFFITVGEVTKSTPTGPDNFGYYAYDSNDTEYDEAPSYEWLEIDPAEGGNGTVILMHDDQVETIKLPLNFKYYDYTPDSITICSNGWISLEPSDEANFRNWNILSALGPYAMIAPYWDDLDGKKNGDENDLMRVCYYHDTVNKKFIVEWNECYSNTDDLTLEKFQLILFDPDQYPTNDGNGEIIFNYQTINNPDGANNYATVGIENTTQSDGLLYSYAGNYPQSASILANELSIKFTTTPPDNYTGIKNEDLFKENTLLGNYPNPFNPSTTIGFYLKKNSDVSLKIYNQNGAVVTTLVNKKVGKGYNSVSWNGKDRYGKVCSSGIYFYTLRVNGLKSGTKRCILFK